LSSQVHPPPADSLQTLEEMEKQMIIASIEQENGNMSTVAKNLGISRPTLYNKMKRYNIQ
jgi:transcriptional regulator of acetoin/glycerol metabolism